MSHSSLEAHDLYLQEQENEEFMREYESVLNQILEKDPDELCGIMMDIFGDLHCYYDDYTGEVDVIDDSQYDGEEHMDYDQFLELCRDYLSEMDIDTLYRANGDI